jgi:predicted DNA-binding protein with PD1-like motif
MGSIGSFSIKRTIVESLTRGSDLYEGLSHIAVAQGIRAGRVTAIGAVERARIAYYDQKTMTYSEIDVPQPMEILSLSGNISLKEGRPFVHVHVVLSDEHGNGKGGHLLPGTRVFSCEITIEEFEGPDIVREKDPASGLFLWKENRRG